MNTKHICKQFMVWNLFESSGFSASIYTSGHKTTEAAW